MPLEIKEYLGNSIKQISSNTSKLDLSESLTSITPISKKSLMVDNEGIHVGGTGNFTWYTEEALDSSIESWTKPYLKPVIMFHNEKDGQIIGRIVGVTKKTQNTRSGTPALVFKCNIPDEEGKKKINDGRLITTSIGIVAEDVRCSICGEQIELDEDGHNIGCEHERGELYEGSICYWTVFKMKAKELSYVIVPSDMYTHNLKVYSPSERDIKLSEELIKNIKSINLNENLNGGNKMSNPLKGIEIDEKDPKGTITNSEDETKTQTPEENENITKENEDTKKEEPKDNQEEIQEDNNTELEDMKRKYEELELKNKELENNLQATKLTLSNKVVELEKANGAIKTEKELREAAENENIKLTKELKESLCDNLNILRQGLNKEVLLDETLNDRNINSIKDSIYDLKEEFNSSFKIKNLKETQDPTLKSKDDSNKKEKKIKENVKDSKSKGNISLKEEAKSILNELF